MQEKLGQEPNNKEWSNLLFHLLLSMHSQNMDPTKLERITVADLIGICQHHLSLSRLDHQSRASIWNAISQQPITVQQTINTEANNTIEAGLTKHRKRGYDKERSKGPLKWVWQAVVEEASESPAEEVSRSLAEEASGSSMASALQTNFERHLASGEFFVLYYMSIPTERAGTTIAEQLVSSDFMASPS